MPIDFSASLDQVRHNWGWYLALGIVLMVIGMVALICPLVTTLVSMVFFGWLLVFSGVAEMLMAFQARQWGGFILNLLAGILELIVGLLVLRSPLLSAEVMTLFLAAYLLVGGLFRMVTAFALAFPGYGLVALSGFISALLGLMLVMQWPGSGLWFIGLCVGIDLLMNGSAWVAFALKAKNLPNAA